MQGEARIFVERRKAPDFWSKSVRWFGIAAWILFGAVIGITSYAKPQLETFFDRLFDIQLRKTWDSELLGYAFYLLVAELVLCLVALLINARRNRRRGDRYNKSVIFMGIFSLIGIVSYVGYTYF